MTSCDTNILFAVCNRDSVHHHSARAFLAAHVGDARFVLCEQVLLELYGLLRNPSVCRSPLTAGEAVAMIQAFRRNPLWRVVDVPPDRTVMDRVWRAASAASPLSGDPWFKSKRSRQWSTTEDAHVARASQCRRSRPSSCATVAS